MINHFHLSGCDDLVSEQEGRFCGEDQDSADHHLFPGLHGRVQLPRHDGLHSSEKPELISRRSLIET